MTPSRTDLEWRAALVKDLTEAARKAYVYLGKRTRIYGSEASKAHDALERSLKALEERQ